MKARELDLLQPELAESVADKGVEELVGQTTLVMHIVFTYGDDKLRTIKHGALEGSCSQIALLECNVMWNLVLWKYTYHSRRCRRELCGVHHRVLGSGPTQTTTPLPQPLGTVHCDENGWPVPFIAKAKYAFKLPHASPHKQSAWLIKERIA